VQVNVTVMFNEGGAGARASNNTFTVLAFPTVISTDPSAGYVSSTITVIGTNFVDASLDKSVSCNVTVGSANARDCRLLDGTRAQFIIDTGTAFGQNGISIIFWPFNFSASASGLLTVLASPTLSSIYPVIGYFSSTISVIGSNFVTLSQDARVSCSAFLNFISAPCSLVNSTFLLVSVSVVPGTYTMELMINTGGATTPNNFAQLPSRSFVVLPVPSVLSAVPSVGYASSTLTLYGTNFIPAEQGGSCVTSVHGIQTLDCRIQSDSTITFVLPSGVVTNYAANLSVSFSNYFVPVIYSKRLQTLASPIIASAQNGVVYVSSVIAVIGSNFVTSLLDPQAECVAYLGGAKSECSLGNDTTISVFVAPETPAGPANVNVTFFTGGAVTPNNNAISAGSIVTVIGMPSLASAVPSAGYISSTITVIGTNFISAEQDASARCSATVGRFTGTCMLVDSSRIKLVIDVGTNAGEYDLVVKFSTASLANSIIVKSAAKFLTVLGKPVFFSVFPLAGYASSTITVTGAHFITTSQDPSPAMCIAAVGNTNATGCVLVNATSVRIVIGSGTSSGGQTLSVTFRTGNAVGPHNVGNSAANFVTILAAPVFSKFTPTAGYQSSSVTVEGLNFITPAQGGDCAAIVNGVASSKCSIMSSTIVVIGLGASPAASNVSILVTFNGGGTGAQIMRNGFVMLDSPVIVSSIPTAGYISSTVTLLGNHFVFSEQDASANCSAFLGDTAAACSLLDANRIKIIVGRGTSAGSKSVAVTFNPARVAANCAAGFNVTVLGPPRLLTAFPNAGYISSTVTVTGENFITTSQDTAATCSATFGQMNVSCTLLGSTTCRIVISSGTPFGRSALKLVINTAGSSFPNNQAESDTNFFLTMDAPALASVSPAVVYATGQMMIFGVNFVTLANDGNAQCICEIGGYAAACVLLSSTNVRITSSSNTPPSMYNLSITFVTGGAVAPFNFARSLENFISVLSNPVISSASFAETASATSSNIVTIFGSNFITPSQDLAANCTGYIDVFLAKSCALVDSQTVVLTMTDTIPSLVQKFSLIIQAGGVSLYSSLPVSSSDAVFTFAI
jgi:hypothetical protein